MTLTADDLLIDFFPRIGVSNEKSRLAAWNEMQNASSVLVHSPLLWSHEDAGWVATTCGSAGEVISWLDFGAASLWVERREPQEGAWIELDRKPLPLIADWFESTLRRLANDDRPGESSFDALTAPATPSALAFDDSDACSDLEGLYEGAGLLLSAVALSLGSSDAVPALSPGTLQASITIPVSGSGQQISSIHIELSPPDELEEAGSYRVSVSADTEITTRRFERSLMGGTVQQGADGELIALLPIRDLITAEDGSEQNARLANFVSSSVNAFLTILD